MTTPTPDPDPANTPIEALVAPLDPGDQAIDELLGIPGEAQGDEDPAGDGAS